MDFEYFEKLSTNDAKQFLTGFLTESGKGFASMQSAIEADDIKVNYSIDSLFLVFKWMLSRLTTLPQSEDKTLPIWIRETDSYKKGLYSFNEASRVMILRYGFYMGESYVRSFQGLKWGVGKRKTAQQNMPVVSGFKNSMELPVLMVCRNMFSAAIEDNETEGAEAAIRLWSTFI